MHKDIDHNSHKSNIDWPILTAIVFYHLALLIALPIYLYHYTPQVSLLATAFLLFIATGISITAGYHRCYSHRAYKANKVVEAILLLFGTMAGQGSALRWSFDHRRHHSYVDTDRDPYSIKKGFWYAHILWLFEKPDAIEPKVVNDLLNNKLVVWQHKYYLPLFFILNSLAFIIPGWLVGDYLGAFLIVWWTRLFVLHHSTWFINSLAHTWGARTYCKELSAVDNYLISLLTFGEGYHNYHHTFASDYRNGIKWYHFDPTKWLIWGLHKLGLVHSLKQVDTYKVKKCVVKKDKDLLINSIQQLNYLKTEVLEKKINEMAEQIFQRINEFHTLREKYQHYKKERGDKGMASEVRREMKKLRKQLYQDWQNWLDLSHNIMRLQPIASRLPGVEK